VPLVTVAVDRDERSPKRTIAWTVRSQRGASRVALFFRTDAAVDSIRINGIVPPPSTRGRSPFARGWHRAVVRGEHMTVEATMQSAEPIDVVALDYSYGVPPAAAPLIAARDASQAVQSDDGDLTVTVARQRIR
jgi:hypothetical protein